MAGKEGSFKENQNVRATAAALTCPNKSGKLTSRTGLSQDELRQPMQVLEVGDRQLTLKHARLSQPFTAHEKFFEPATA